MSDVTQILSRIEGGDPTAADQLLPLVYDELRKLAAAKMMQEKPGQTLQATALVHEAYLRLVMVSQPVNWNNRGHFFSAAAEAMRRILVDGARRKSRSKHGSGKQHLNLDDFEIAIPERESSGYDLLALDEAITALAATDSQKAKLVQLRFFAGLGNDEAAKILGISCSTAKRHWRYARLAPRKTGTGR